MAIAEGRTPPLVRAGSSEVTVPAQYIWATARIALGWVFLWPFLDKLFGLGFATPADRAWIAGGSPTTGFLKGTGQHGLGGFFTALAGHAWVDWLYMLGSLGIGGALIVGAGVRIAAITGTILLLMLWAAQLPLVYNPFLDEHILYAIVLIGLASVSAGDTFGIGRWWGETALVHRYPILK
ncbi:hypothetical protein Skr01_26860 [Sphaerisporangium krabiense]|uniref:Thiosulfate dehydrogenase [quinone] large subunit n=1 Tax=Sphaerisporangium krabiense TaxID=763782 RepID=A0A7W8ZAM8_9ACTN|nr:hypothetical protein [Sphaerisporangium krabiense]MBB5630446.1 thiosulfate dehydrogenase [quinone] large subunit [Sphaerisporangium krabiense]GII62601.1 hypothetical protein Skr01_26860 [Sphaerisporangium krabiense]